jgi:hypothetical protein
MMNLEEEIFDPEPDEDDDEQHLRNDSWYLPGPPGQIVRATGSNSLLSFSSVSGPFHFRGGLFTDNPHRSNVRRSGIINEKRVNC